MDPEPPSTPTAKAPSVVELQEQHQEALRSASYKASPLHTSTKDLLAEIGLAPKKEISNDELKQGITEALQKCGLAGMTRGKMRVELEGKFETNLADRLGDIGAEMMKQIRNWKKETETVAPPKSVEPKVKAEQAATLVDLTPKEDTVTDDVAKGGTTKNEDVGDTPTTVKAASGLVDSRHKKTKIDEPENNSYGLVFPKNLGSGSNVSVLVELHKPKATLPVDLDGDSGAIGRVSLLDPEGKAHDALEATKGKKRKSIHSWDTEAAARYGKGSKLRLDLKGDVYHGSFLKSNVTMCAVTVTSKHGAKVTGVFNSYVRASFEGNVLEGMRGEPVDEK